MELAEPFAVSQPAISKHLKVLERAGLVSVGLDAQKRPRRLEPERLQQASAWIEEYRRKFEKTYQRPRYAARRIASDHKEREAPCQTDLRSRRRAIAKSSSFAPSGRRAKWCGIAIPSRIWCGAGSPGRTAGPCPFARSTSARAASGAMAGRKRGRDGFEMHGVFREIAPHDRIVHTENFMGGEAIVTNVFRGREGRQRNDADHAVRGQGRTRRRAQVGYERRHGDGIPASSIGSWPNSHEGAMAIIAIGPPMA